MKDAWIEILFDLTVGEVGACKYVDIMSSTLEYRIQNKTKRLRTAAPGTKRFDESVDYLLECLPYMKAYEHERTRDLVRDRDDDDEPGPTERKAPVADGINQFVDVGPERDTKRVFDQYLAFVEKDEQAMVRVSLNIEDKQHRHNQLQESTVRRVIPSLRDLYLSKGDHDHCEQCGNRLLVDERMAQRVCTGCGLCTPMIEDSVRLLTHTEQLERGGRKNFTYKRTSHFIETLASVQGRQRAFIPDEVLQQVNGEISKYRMDPEDVTTAHIRSFLKRLGLSKYYDNAPLIRNIILGSTSDTIPSGIEKRLITMFIQIQRPFDDVCERGRKNMLRYGYISYKLLELMGDQGAPYLHLFPLLKSKQKLAAHDATWKKICEAVGWKFIPTV